MNRITVTLALAGLLAAPLAASATTVTECQGLLGELKTATQTATFKNTKDQTGLVTKLDNASSTLNTTKLNAKKIADAGQKVSDYQSKLMELVNAGKISQATFDALNYGVDGVNAGADDVQACIAEIQL